MRQLQPRWPLVVEGGQRAGFRLGGALRVLWSQTSVANRPDAAGVGVVEVALPCAVLRTGRLRHFLANPLGRVEPVGAQLAGVLLRGAG